MIAPEGSEMDESERLRLEYDAAVEVVRGLTDVRFKLLALVPTLAGAVVALASPKSTAVELLAIGLLGATATAGVLLYELRNTQIRGVAAARARAFEARNFAGGPLVPPPRAVGSVALGHSFGVALVYGAALAGWSYLIAWGALRAAHAGHARAIGLLLGVLAGVVLVESIRRLEASRPLPEAAARAAHPASAAPPTL
jgi:hypothetical protein